MEYDNKIIGQQIALDAVNNINEIEQNKLRQELILENLRFQIESIRLKKARLMQERVAKEYATQMLMQAYYNTPTGSSLEMAIRSNIMMATGDMLLKSLEKLSNIPETTETQKKPDAETTAEEVSTKQTPDQQDKKERPERPETKEPKQVIDTPTESQNTTPAGENS